MSPSPTPPTLRPATSADAEAIAVLWHDGWRDGHLGHVPEALLAHRGLDDFRERVPSRIPQTTVATSGGRIVGFVTIVGDELEQLYVAGEARGGGVARTLIRHAEDVIGGAHPTAWLAVASGNARARRFYEREGWRDAGHVDYPAEVRGGTLVVPCRRYEKAVGAVDRD